MSIKIKKVNKNREQRQDVEHHCLSESQIWQRFDKKKKR